MKIAGGGGNDGPLCYLDTCQRGTTNPTPSPVNSEDVTLAPTKAAIHKLAVCCCVVHFTMFNTPKYVPSAGREKLSTSPFKTWLFWKTPLDDRCKKNVETNNNK